ncbi:MAG: hypothetical protein EPO57_03940 [Chitinophagaceae bacterium]|nr:MAG: hypothetical protein EPO57_03940 [Chitinophagaceae bacterium]
MSLEKSKNSRRKFISNTCKACVAATFLGTSFNSCQTIRYINASINNDGLMVPISEFVVLKNNKPEFRPFIIVRNESLLYPICIYRMNEREYNAVWMKCSHQGTELKASAMKLYCSAHGSEFSNQGIVLNGPASENLKTFTVTVNKNELFIDLRKS